MSPIHELLSSSPGTAGLVMDFDGVLSPITSNPDSSRPLPGVAEVLASLAKRLGLVGLLSGRSATFLHDRLPVPGVVLLGSYGLERQKDDTVDVLPAAIPWLSAVDFAEAALRAQLADQLGVQIERKSLAVAAHWRRASSAEAAAVVRRIVEGVASATGLRVEPGKAVLELRAPLEEDKGTALRRLTLEHRLKHIAYAGDDRGDLPAFRAARDLQGSCIVVMGADTDPEVAAIEGTRLNGPDEFLAWLTDLDRILS